MSALSSGLFLRTRACRGRERVGAGIAVAENGLAVLRALPLQLRALPRVLGLQVFDLLLEIEYSLYPSEVRSQLLSELLDVPSELHVFLRIKPRVLQTLAWTQETLLLVHTQRLRMNPNQISGDTYHENRPLTHAVPESSSRPLPLLRLARLPQEPLAYVLILLFC